MKLPVPIALFVSITLIARPGLGAGEPAVPGAGTTILTVDMKKLFDAHPKAIEAQKEMEAASGKPLAGVPDERMDQGRRIQEEVTKLDQTIASGELVGDGLAKARRQRAEKMEALRAVAGDIQKTQMVRDKESQEKTARLRTEIVGDLRKAIEATPALTEATILLDKSGPSSNGVPVVVYSNPKLDRTDSVGKPAGKADPGIGKGLNVAVLDLKRIFAGYKKTKISSEKINEERRVASKEFLDLATKATAALDALKKLDAQLADSGLSAAERAKRSQERAGKAALAQSLDRDTRQYQASHEKQFQDESIKVRKEILDDIDRVVLEGVKADGHVDLILDSSATSLIGVPFVLRHEDVPDWTDAIIIALNGAKDGGKGTGNGSVSTNELHFAMIDMKRVFETSRATRLATSSIEEAKKKAAAAEPAERRQKEKEIQESLLKMQAVIGEKLNQALADAAGKVGCQVVLDASGPSINGIPVVMVQKNCRICRRKSSRRSVARHSEGNRGKLPPLRVANY